MPSRIMSATPAGNRSTADRPETGTSPSTYTSRRILSGERSGGPSRGRSNVVKTALPGEGQDSIAALPSIQPIKGTSTMITHRTVSRISEPSQAVASNRSVADLVEGARRCAATQPSPPWSTPKPAGQTHTRPGRLAVPGRQRDPMPEAGENLPSEPASSGTAAVMRNG